MAETSINQVGKAHSVIGLVVIGFLFLQPLFGLMHHFIYLRSHGPTSWGLTHVWVGRGIIVLGMINGGLGLQLANNSTKGEIAYGVIAGVVFVLYIGVILIGDRRSGKARMGGRMSENITEKSAQSPAESQGQVA